MKFTDEFICQFRQLLVWRRDVRHFRPDPLPAGVLEQLIDLACLAPSVGLSQPWRFVSVSGSAMRSAIRAGFEQSNQEALSGFSGEQATLYARLKLAGLDTAPIHLAVFSDKSTQQGFGLGRRTMPETLEYSVVGAINTLWLAARVYGVGLGWVSILDPERVTAILSVPPTWQLVAYLCMGYPKEDSQTPELERAGWERRSGKTPLLER